MKRYVPFFVGAAVLVFLLWRAFGRAGAARRERQGELDSILGR